MKTSTKIASILVAYFLLLPVISFFVGKLNLWGIGISFDDIYIGSLVGVVVLIGMTWKNRTTGNDASPERDV